MDGAWSLHLYRWRGVLSFSGRDYPFEPGSLSLAPPLRRLTWRFPPKPCVHLYMHFRVSSSRSPGHKMPVVMKAGAAFESLWEAGLMIVELWKNHALRAEIRLWDMLLHMTTLQAPRRERLPDHPPALKTALVIIDQEIRDTLRVGEIAGRVGVSRNHLIHLFHRHLGCTPHAYIRQKRFAIASKLLAREDIPMLSIAEECGMPSLQHFNKFIRAMSGYSPRAFRLQIARE